MKELKWQSFHVSLPLGHIKETTATRRWITPLTWLPVLRHFSKEKIRLSSFNESSAVESQLDKNSNKALEILAGIGV